MIDKKSRGFVYIATGQYYVAEALASVRSLKKSSPKCQAVLYTDELNIQLASSEFHQVIKIDEPSFNFIDKIIPLTSSPFDQTIFLDTDTYVKEDISNLFDILEKYDLMACFAPGRDQMNLNETIPPYFPEFNTGLIGFNNTEKVRSLFKSWFELYQSQIRNGDNPPHDQPALREVLFNSDVTLYCLPHEYNFRISQPNVLFSNSKAMVIHGRSNDFKRLSNILDQQSGNVRLYFHNLRYLSGKWLQVLEVKQNNYFSVKFLLKVFVFLSKVEDKLFGSDLVRKKKGN